ncbi:SdrD B-like domain-containing protein [Thiothrix sp.]|jgi:uncharacterized repeat protein (TIGR01451 family)|nr:SdrD B-like domain-containing protein [Thiothrix sp.]
MRNQSYFRRCAGSIILTLCSTAAYADISGTVFRDFNANGVKDNAANFNESGIGGITVSCTDSSGGTGSTTTSSTPATLGHYTLTGCSGASRVEFKLNLPDDYPSAIGTNNTNLQFITAPQTGVNFGVNYPVDYCDVTPKVIIPMQHTADGTGSNSTSPALRSFSFSASGQSLSSSVTEITKSEIGTTWGIAYDRVNKRIFQASFLKRHAGLKDGLGYIYIGSQSGSDINYTDSFNLQGIIPSNGGNPIDLGTICRDASCATTWRAEDYEMPVHPASHNLDLDSFAKAGKTGLGGLELTPDNKTLWAVNLFQRALIRMDATQASNAFPGAVQQYPIDGMAGIPSCTGGIFRPFALTFHRNKGYLGGVCDASLSKNRSDLKAYILAFNPSSPIAFDTVANVDLNYNRHGGDFQAGINFNYSLWHPWQDTWADYGLPENAGDVAYAVPILSDIAFDDNESMTIALMDRFAQQTGHNALTPIPGNWDKYIAARSRGDIIHFCHDAAGLYSVEGSAQCPVNFPDMSNNAGPRNNGEFYYDSVGDLSYEGALGSIAYLKGVNEMLASVFDPVTPGVTNDPSTYFTQGIHWFGAKNGQQIDFLRLASTSDGQFGKGSGLGEVELLCPPAPIEIGNRVWLDSDNDGLQDAGETGIAGVQVKLMQGATELASATTTADGTYAFSSATGTTTTSHIYGLTALVPNTTYTVKFPTTTTVGATTYNLTSASAGSNREVDSNAPATGEVSVAASDIPQSGANNYSFDVGYGTTPPAAGCTTITNIANISKLTETDPTAANNSASAAIQANCVTPKTDLKLVKTVSKPTVRHGDAITYTITLINDSDVEATGVKVEDRLPTGLTLVTATPSQGTFAAGVWNVGTVAARATLTLTLAVTVD